MISLIRCSIDLLAAIWVLRVKVRCVSKRRSGTRQALNLAISLPNLSALSRPNQNGLLPRFYREGCQASANSTRAHGTPGRYRFRLQPFQPNARRCCRGGYSEMMIAQASGLAAIPDDLLSTEAAPPLCAGVTRNAFPSKP